MSTVPNGLLKPLKIRCVSTNCANDLHCFQLTKKLLMSGPSGRCRSCGVELVDWDRVHARNLLDVEYTFSALRYELIRHHFWHIPLSQYAINYARRKGGMALREAARKTIQSAVGNPTHPAQGRQTPRETNRTANAIHYAQHATACCCRKCLAEWHGISVDRVLGDDEISYLTDLVMLYVAARIPDLAEGPTSISRRAPQAQFSDASQARVELPHAS
jgi:Domain of unknown function (DUF4186)